MLALAAVALAIGGSAIVGIPELRDLTGIGTAAGPASSPSPAMPSPTPGIAPEPTPATPTLRPNSPYVPAEVDRYHARERLQAALDADRLAVGAPGMVASVLFADGSMWTGVSGVADLATKRPLTPTTPFAVASISKTFLAAEIMELVDSGSLTLDQGVAPLLPGVLVANRAIDPRITIRELLDHTSGLRDYLIDPRLDKAVVADPTAVWTPERALAYAGKPWSVPGVAYHYSNTNFVLLGLIAERITGRTLAEEYRTRFFDPLRMTSASYQGAEPPSSEMPTSYDFSSNAVNARPRALSDGTDIRPFTAITTAAGAAGSVAVSAPDLVHWARSLYGGRVLPDATVAEMVGQAARTATLRPGYPYGLGVQVVRIDGRISYGHSGRLLGARSVLRWFPDEGIAIAVLTNDSRFDPTKVLRDLLAVVAPEHVPARPRVS